MFYEENLIAGRIYFRTSPKGEWKELPLESLSARYMALKKENYKNIARVGTLEELLGRVNKYWEHGKCSADHDEELWADVKKHVGEK